MTCRSPLFYVGDKRKLIKEIKTYFPQKISRFIEPFVGGGSVFMNTKADGYVLNDINENVISLHKMLCAYATKRGRFFKDFLSIVRQYNLSCSYEEDTVPEKLKQQFPKTYFAEYNREGYGRLKEFYNSADERNPLMLYVLLIYGFNRILRFNSKGFFNVPVGNVDFNDNVYEALNNYFDVASKAEIKWENKDFETFVSSLKLNRNDFVYLDPPYLLTFSEYNKIWNDETESRLLSCLDKLNKKNIRFAISNVTHYKGRVNDCFLAWSSKYNIHSIKSNYISYHDNSVKKINEVLVTNY